MDYHRIYLDFIKDRRAKEPGLTGYVEKHHILPRSLGGGDEPENLIALTPEDHFFAHLLLAKMHGGKMAAALFCMLQITDWHWGRRHASRGRYGLAKRLAMPALSAQWTGENNPLFNSTVYRWVNYRTGSEELATLFEMHKKHGASRGSWTSVANGHRPSIKGWLLACDLSVHKKSDKGQVNRFVHRDGRSFIGTQGEFCAHTGLNDASSWRVVHQRSVTRCGWRLDGVMDRTFNAPRDGSKTGPKPKVYTLIKGDQSVRGSRSEIAQALGSTPQQISAAMNQIAAGKCRGYKGWRLVKEERPDAIAA